MSISRSDFLKTSAASAAAAALGTQAIAQAETPASSLKDIDYFFILMQENRAFDHYFGTLRGVRGFDDPNAMRLRSGRSVFYQPDPGNRDGYELPFRLNTLTTNAQRLHDLSHAWGAQHASYNGGAMDNFVPAHRAINGVSGPLTMGYYTREDLPFHYALADAFTICDGYFCSVLGPTYPNRLYHWSASIDPGGMHGGPVIDNAAVRGDKQYTWETYPEALERAGVSWQVFYDMEDDYLLDILRYFPTYQAPALRQKALTGRPFASFLDDLHTGNVPQVTWIVAHAEQCEHPAYLPAQGANYMRQILEELWTNPTLWAKSAVIVNYDENDGLFDHVHPPSPPPHTRDEFVAMQNIGLGFRVPCIVISPYSRGGYVCGDTFDHTSTLQLLEARFGVEVPNLTQWRRETCGDLTTAFGFGAPPDLSIPTLPETEVALAVAERNASTLPRPEVPSPQSVPVQEPGTKPRRGKSA